MTKSLTIAAFTFGLGAAGLASAADFRMPIQNAAACAPRTSDARDPDSPLHVVGAQDTNGRTLLGPRDLMVIGGGHEQGVELGQQYFVRRGPGASRLANLSPYPVSTKGWVQIVAVNETTAIATVVHACDGIVAGDFLEPYAPLELPADIDRTDIAGELDFSSPSRVLFGDDGRRDGAPGDFMVLDAGAQAGIMAGARFGIFRDLDQPGLPLASVGEAVVVTVAPDTSIFRITSSRNVVEAGDLLIPRRRQ